jgi:uncharacterized surface anchored protein
MISLVWAFAVVEIGALGTPQAKAKITGKVLGPDGKPVAGALVSLRTGGGEARSPSTTTDDSGTFTFADLAPGEYFLSAWKGGYVFQSFGGTDGAGSTSSAPIRIERGDEAVTVTIPLHKGGVITGKVTDERGDPVVGATMQVSTKEQAMTLLAGPLRLLQFFTDDRGMYRVYGLPTGKYVVAVDPKGFSLAGGGPDAPVTYYPGVMAKDEAQEVEVTAGSESGEINFKLSSSRKMAKVFGQVVRRSDGSPVTNSAILIFKENDMSTQQMLLLGAEGRYEFKNLPAGNYTIFVSTQEARLAERTVSRVTLASEPVEMMIEVDEAAEIAGQCELEGGRKVDSVQGLTVVAMIEADQLSQYTGRVNPDGSFALARLPSGSYRLVLRAEKSKYYLKRIVYEDIDITDEVLPVESGAKLGGVRVILSDASGTVRGTVLDRTGAAVAGATVSVVPRDPEFRRSARYTRTGLSDHQGSFVIEGIAPGKYRVLAVRDVKRLGKEGVEELLSRPTKEVPIIEVRAKTVEQLRLQVID